jgi:hypothetical protein
MEQRSPHRLQSNPLPQLNPSRPGCIATNTAPHAGGHSGTARASPVGVRVCEFRTCARDVITTSARWTRLGWGGVETSAGHLVRGARGSLPRRGCPQLPSVRSDRVSIGGPLPHRRRPRLRATLTPAHHITDPAPHRPGRPDREPTRSPPQRGSGRRSGHHRLAPRTPSEHHAAASRRDTSRLVCFLSLLHPLKGWSHPSRGDSP